MANLEASEPTLTHRNIIVIGGSSGSIEVLKTIVKGLPVDFPAAIFIVTHISPDHNSYLAEILQRYGPLPATTAAHGETFRPGRIYVTPPDHHLLIEQGYVRLWRGPKENHSRPSINPTFRSAAKAYGPRVIGVILSGFLDDGTSGLIAIKLKQGVAVVQDPADADHSDMPRSALRYIDADYVLPAARIAPLLIELTQRPAPEPTVATGAISMGENGDKDSLKVKQDIAEIEAGEKTNTLTMIVCPDCGGPMWEFRNNEFKHFQCRVGHKFSPESILANHADTLERALWVAVRTLEERCSLTREMANVARHTSSQSVLEKFESEAEEAGRNAEIIRRMLLNGDNGQH
jgi:two-component system, chemotaxis family, protein-glutamate methylesterase/glutaminase